MKLSRRSVGLMLIGAGGLVLAGPAVARLLAHPSTSAGWPELVEGQDQAPNRREFTIVAKDYHYAPDRIEVMQDDLVKLTVRSVDIAHSFAIDEYRIVKRVPAGGSTTFEFQADRAGTFAFYCNLTSEPGHKMLHGELVVRAR
jgi:heme/copper-type cytochrome/quinol oxidase subunit 2